jgi:hypothetical protein
MELWKDIRGYEGLYRVSNYGRIKSLGNDKKRKEKILTSFINGVGYVLIKLSKEGKQYNHRLHRLVAEAFIDNPLNKPEVNHIDGNKSNNNISNLEWSTRSENVQHSFNHNLKPKGESHVMAKLSNEEVIGIYFKSHEGKLKQREIAKQYNISRETVAFIKTGRVWNHLTQHILL